MRPTVTVQTATFGPVSFLRPRVSEIGRVARLCTEAEKADPALAQSVDAVAAGIVLASMGAPQPKLADLADVEAAADYGDEVTRWMLASASSHKVAMEDLHAAQTAFWGTMNAPAGQPLETAATPT
jgi:hypothetical protein